MAGPTEITVPKGKIVARQGSPGGALIMLKRGTYEMVANQAEEGVVCTDEQVARDGRVIEVVSGADVFVGESGVILGRHVASYRTAEECVLRVLPINVEKATAMILKTPMLGVQMGKSLAQRLREVNKLFSGQVGRVNRFKQQLEEYYVSFYRLAEGIMQDGQDEEAIEAAYKDARLMETYKRGRRVAEATRESADAFKAVLSEGTGKTKDIKRGDVLCNEGDRGNEMWILTKGELWVYIQDQKVGVIKQGEIVGEMLVLLDHKQRTAKLVASQNCILGIIPGDKFLDVARANPKIVWSLCNLLSVRLRNTIQILLTAGATVKETLQNLLQNDRCTVEDFKKMHGSLVDYQDVLYRECDELDAKRASIEKMFAEFESELAGMGG